MELVHLDIVEHGERVLGEHCERAVQGDQVGGDGTSVDLHEAHRQPHPLLPREPGLEQSDHALARLTGAQQQELRPAVLQRDLVRRNDRQAAPGQEL